MKRTFTSLSFSVKQAVSQRIFALLCAAFFCIPAFGQNNGPIEDFSYLTTVVWKPNVDLDASLVQERSRMDVALSQPGLQDGDRSLFMAYQRLLDYIQADMGSKPVPEAITTNYEKVLTEAPGDPDLKSLPDGILGTYLPGLVELLTKVPVPGQ